MMYCFITILMMYGSGRSGWHCGPIMMIRYGLCHLLSEYNPAYQTLHFSDTSLMHLRSSSVYSDALCIGLHMLCNSTPPPASVPSHVPPLLVCLFVYLCHQHTCCLFCLFVSPSGLVPLIDGQGTSAKSNCTHSIRRGLGRRLRSSLLLNSSPSTSRDHPLVA